MKKVTSLQQLQNAINSKLNFSHEIAGKKYELHAVRLLSMSLLDIINMINNGELFVESDH